MGNALIREYNKIKYVCAEDEFGEHEDSGKSSGIPENAEVRKIFKNPENPTIPTNSGKYRAPENPRKI